MSTDKQTEVRSTVEALSTERALKLARQLISNLRTHSWTTSDEQFVLKAIDEALAEQPAEQEPVAWMWRCKPYCNWPEWSVSLKRPADSGRDGHKRTEGYEDVPLYTFPPASKPWVGLTQQDIDIAFDDTQEGGGFNEFARAIEAKLRGKNA